MPRSLAPQVVDLDGEGVDLAAASAADTFVPNERGYLEVLNSSAGSINVTLDSVERTQFGSDENPVIAVAAGVRKKIGPLYPKRFLNPATGVGSAAFSAFADVTVGYFVLGDPPY